MFKTGVPAAHSTILELPCMSIVLLNCSHPKLTSHKVKTISMHAWLGLIKWVIDFQRVRYCRKLFIPGWKWIHGHSTTRLIRCVLNRAEVQTRYRVQVHIMWRWSCANHTQAQIVSSYGQLVITCKFLPGYSSRHTNHIRCSRRPSQGHHIIHSLTQNWTWAVNYITMTTSCSR
jgi:hypothetical protein